MDNNPAVAKIDKSEGINTLVPRERVEAPKAESEPTSEVPTSPQEQVEEPADRVTSIASDDVPEMVVDLTTGHEELHGLKPREPTTGYADTKEEEFIEGVLDYHERPSQ